MESATIWKWKVHRVLLCCPIMCLCVLRFLLWCLLHFPHRKRYSIRLYLQLFVRGLISYLRYLCLLALSGVQQILCCGFFFRLVVSFSRLSIFGCPFGIFIRLFILSCIGFCPFIYFKHFVFRNFRYHMYAIWYVIGVLL